MVCLYRARSVRLGGVRGAGTDGRGSTSSPLALLLLLLCACGCSPVSGSEQSAQIPRRWQLDWHRGGAPPPRRVMPLRKTYTNYSSCDPWLECVTSRGLLPSLSDTPWPPGTHVLFIGVSYVRQLAEAAVLDVPDGEIKSMKYLKYRNALERRPRCACTLSTSRTCPASYRLQELLSGGSM